jgi:hypothetical protein
MGEPMNKNYDKSLRILAMNFGLLLISLPCSV